MRYFSGSIIGFTIFHLAIRQKKRINNNQIISIFFHNPTVFLFEECMTYLLKKSYTFLSSERLEQLLTNKEKIDKKYVHITLDDGWRENLKLLPIIEKYHVYLTLFVSTEPIISGNFWWEYVQYSNKSQETKNMRKEELKVMNNSERLKIISELKSKFKLQRSTMTIDELIEFSKSKYITIGSHTVNHPITIMCSDQELEDEYYCSKKTIEEWLNKEVKYFAFPNGDYNTRDLDYLRKMNYKMSFSIEPKNINHSTDMLQIPRFGMNDEMGFYENLPKMFGIGKKMTLLLKRKFQSIKSHS